MKSTGTGWTGEGRRVSKLRRWMIRAVAFGLLGAVVASATTVKRLTLTDVTEQATAVFVGTVRATESVPGNRGRGLVFTETTFEKLDVLKGTLPGSTATYRFAGGTLNGRTVTVSGMPKYEIGRRYVLFVHPQVNWICPTVGWWQGRYEVRKDRKSGEEFVHTSAGRPVYRFSRGRPVTRKRRLQDRPVKLSVFLAQVRKILERQAGRIAATDASGTTPGPTPQEGKPVETPKESGVGPEPEQPPEPQPEQPPGVETPAGGGERVK